MTNLMQTERRALRTCRGTESVPRRKVPKTKKKGMLLQRERCGFSLIGESIKSALLALSLYELSGKASNVPELGDSEWVRSLQPPDGSEKSRLKRLSAALEISLNNNNNNSPDSLLNIVHAAVKFVA